MFANMKREGSMNKFYQTIYQLTGIALGSLGHPVQGQKWHRINVIVFPQGSTNITINYNQIDNFTESPVFFYHDGYGYREGTAWVAPDDGILAIDLE